MKKLELLGKSLSKTEQRMIVGGITDLKEYHCTCDVTGSACIGVNFEEIYDCCEGHPATCMIVNQ